jgi:hypothetical protein
VAAEEVVRLAMCGWILGDGFVVSVDRDTAVHFDVVRWCDGGLESMN